MKEIESMKTKLIHKNTQLEKTLLDLFDKFDRCSFAVAWASNGTSIFKEIIQAPEKIEKAIVGTHFYQTHPDVLDQFVNSENFRFWLNTDGVFHPKLYAFWNKASWAILIGSANLTKGAMEKNSEAMVLIEDDTANSELLKNVCNLIDDYWKNASAVDAEKAKQYRGFWERKTETLQTLSGQFGTEPKGIVPINSAIMSMDWAEYYTNIKDETEHTFEKRCKLISEVQKLFAVHNPYHEMDYPRRKTIAGIKEGHVKNAGWFGSMKGAGHFKKAVKNNSRHLSDALEYIPLHGIVTREQYMAYIEEFAKIKPDYKYIAPATRLLSMKRPDQFVCLTTNNKTRLCSEFKIVKKDMSYERYWDEIVERIMDSNWWNEPEPKEIGLEQISWKSRAAMLDAIFYKSIKSQKGLV